MTTDPAAPRFMRCPVCDGEDSLNVNASAEGYAVDLCERCNTDIHSDESFNFEGPCPFGCGKKTCYCGAREEWKKVLACQHAYVVEEDPELNEYEVKRCPKCSHYQMRKKVT